jgi:hypothetical protein
MKTTLKNVSRFGLWLVVFGLTLDSLFDERMAGQCAQLFGLGVVSVGIFGAVVSWVAENLPIAKWEWEEADRRRNDAVGKGGVEIPPHLINPHDIIH